MRYLDFAKLDAIDDAAFRATRPFPWINPSGLLTPEGFATLVAELPSRRHFVKTFGMARAFGQRPHDRYELMYDGSQPLPKAWAEFLDELRGPRYRAFVRRMTGRRDFITRFQWQVAVRGCAVSPHTDGTRKIASHLFYLDTEKEWDPAWGGQTLVLDDGGKLDWRSAPDYGDFASETAARAMAPHSFIFMRTERSWHAVRPLACPEGAERRIFSVVVDAPPTLKERVGGLLKKLIPREA